MRRRDIVETAEAVAVLLVAIGIGFVLALYFGT
jgi:hypothetical protein